MKRTWTIIGVADVARSFKWYESLFGQRETTPAHDDWGQIIDTDGTVLLCLHQALVRARALVARLQEEPHLNPSTGTREFALRDPDGYVMVSALA